MIKKVVISRGAKKQLKKVPARVAAKLRLWVEGVEQDGLEKVRKVPGYHDELLRGARKGQRSIRLSIHYRAVYVMRKHSGVEFVQVEEVTKHEY